MATAAVLPPSVTRHIADKVIMQAMRLWDERGA